MDVLVTQALITGMLQFRRGLYVNNHLRRLQDEYHGYRSCGLQLNISTWTTNCLSPVSFAPGSTSAAHHRQHKIKTSRKLKHEGN